ncbi:MAG: hypothetical protein IJU30_07185 [Lachnospiraceae bacterium]|nr:hypothetical protein [Lachnospiraceae bacterium]
MKCMHTRLPDYYAKVEAAAKKLRPETKFSISGMENVQTAKLASLRCGRIEREIEEVTEDPEIAEIEIKMVPYNPEEAYSVLIKGKRADGSCKKAVLDNMYATVPSVEYYMTDAEEIIDYRTGSRQYDV